MDEIKVFCNPTSREMRLSVRRVFREKRRSKIIAFSIVFLLLSVLLFVNYSLMNLVLGFICVGFAVVIPLVHLISAFAAIRDTERQEFVLTLTDRDVSFDSKHRFSTDYPSCEAFEDDKVVTFLAESSQVYCVPLRCFENDAQREAFLKTVKEKLKERYKNK